MKTMSRMHISQAAKWRAEQKGKLRRGWGWGGFSIRLASSLGKSGIPIQWLDGYVLIHSTRHPL